MLIADLVNNIALLVALVTIYQVVAFRIPNHGLAQPIIVGTLFGAVGILGMMTPIHFAGGLIFDGRSVILSVAGLFGGPLVAVISASLMSMYRIWLGGIGAITGTTVILASAAIGVAFHFYYARTIRRLSALQFYIMGLVVHCAMLGIMLLLPGQLGLRVLLELGLVIILLYPIATMLVALLIQDYAEQQESRKKLHRLAYYDSLTGLPNRQYLLEKLTDAMRQPHEHSRLLLLINLDRFKMLNDARGHLVGDQMLCALTARLSEHMKEGDVLARMSADEFAVLLHMPEERFRDMNMWSQYVAEKIQAAIKFPTVLGEDEVSISSSIGIASFQADGDTASNILRRADTAMHRAKQNGGNQSVIFELDMASSVEHKYTIERELRKAIPARELVLYLQSQVDAAGRIVGAEALVRWQHPQQGLVPPMTFIPVAEESDLIVELGNWTLMEACAILAREEIFSLPMRLSVNISPRHFHDPKFVASVKRALASTGADATHLTLEVTESMLIQNINEVVAKMVELAALGIHFSLDDFGTGYSSLSYLKRLPIHEIKIDKSFVQDAPSDPDDAALVESILAVAQHMQLDVVAEGVETQAQADFLNARAKVVHQGYFFHKPEPSESWISRHFGMPGSARDNKKPAP